MTSKRFRNPLLYPLSYGRRSKTTGSRGLKRKGNSSLTRASRKDCDSSGGRGHRGQAQPIQPGPISSLQGFPFPGELGVAIAFPSNPRRRQTRPGTPGGGDFGVQKNPVLRRARSFRLPRLHGHPPEIALHLPCELLEPVGAVFGDLRIPAEVAQTTLQLLFHRLAKRAVHAAAVIDQERNALPARFHPKETSSQPAGRRPPGRTHSTASPVHPLASPVRAFPSRYPNTVFPLLKMHREIPWSPWTHHPRPASVCRSLSPRQTTAPPPRRPRGIRRVRRGNHLSGAWSRALRHRATGPGRSPPRCCFRRESGGARCRGAETSRWRPHIP